MPALTSDELAAFLCEPGHLVRIGVVDEDGSPLVVPAWFLLRDDAILFTPRERSAWYARLRADPRVCVSIDEGPPPYRKVTVRGTVRERYPPGSDDAWRDVYREIAVRYVPDAAADGYLQMTWGEPRALLEVRLSESSVSTWRMPLPGESPRGIWADRYYHNS